MAHYGVVIGLDLSLTSTGVARVTNGRVVGTNSIRTAGKKGDDLQARAKRLESIVKSVYVDLCAFNPELVVVEAPSYGSQHGAQHDRSGLWWLVVQATLNGGWPVATVSPNGRAKYGTGKGNSPKDAVLAAVIKRYPEVTLNSNDEADALLLASMGSRHLGWPIEDELPKAHLDAMDGAYWPASIG